MENTNKADLTPKQLLKKLLGSLTIRSKRKSPKQPLDTTKGNFSLKGIRGSRFPGRQSSATALCAVLQAKCLSPSSWSPQVLDRLLLQGDKLHTTRVHHLGRLDSITLRDLPTNFSYKHKELNTSFSKSETFHRHTHKQAISKALQRHFRDNQHGVLLTSGDITLALMADETYCYLFHPCTDIRSASGESRSELLKFRDFEHLTLYLSEIPMKQTTELTAVRIDIKFDVWTDLSFSRSLIWV